MSKKMPSDIFSETSLGDDKKKALILSEALPYMQRYDGKTVVIKYGGHAMGNDKLAKAFAKDIALLKQSGVNPIVVHGGGPQIGAMLEKLNIKSDFKEGLRVTDKATVDVVEMVLAGSINKKIVGNINAAGGLAVGLCGKDGNLITAEKLTRTKRDPESHIEQILDLGFVGEPKIINTAILDTILKSNIIPVIAPLGISAEGDTYNINADTAAGAIASAVGAKRLLMLTDVTGVLDEAGALIEELSADKAQNMIETEAISGGMIPKVETCLNSVEGGVEASVILDGQVPHAVLLELFTEHGVGTLISN